MICTNKLLCKRVLLGISVEQISKMLDLHRVTYREKELGKKEFKASEIKQLMQLLNLTPEEVVEIFLS